MSIEPKTYEEKPLHYFGTPRTEIVALLPEKLEFDRVLEIGCGSGATMAWLKQKRRIVRCVGIDLMLDAVEQARLVFDEAVTADIETDALPSEQFDLIIACDVLEHLSDPWRMVQRLHAVLAPGGSMVVSLPHVGHWTVSWPLLTRGQWNYTDDGLLDRTHLRFFSVRGAADLMTSSGLVLQKVNRTRLAPALLSKLSPKLRWYAQRAMETVMPSHLLTYQLLIRVGHSSLPMPR